MQSLPGDEPPAESCTMPHQSTLNS